MDFHHTHTHTLKKKKREIEKRHEKEIIWKVGWANFLQATLPYPQPHGHNAFFKQRFYIIQ